LSEPGFLGLLGLQIVIQTCSSSCQSSHPVNAYSDFLLTLMIDMINIIWQNNETHKWQIARPIFLTEIKPGNV